MLVWFWIAIIRKINRMLTKIRLETKISSFFNMPNSTASKYLSLSTPWCLDTRTYSREELNELRGPPDRSKFCHRGLKMGSMTLYPPKSWDKMSSRDWDEKSIRIWSDLPTETHWDPLRPTETHWDPLRTTENHWDPLRPTETLRDQLRPTASQWDPLRPTETHWDPLRFT